jgi:hypothetical protein
LRARKKQGVAGADVNQYLYDNPEAGGVRVFGGLLIAGSPVGSPAYVDQQLGEIVRDKVQSAFAAVAKMDESQEQHLLNSQCCGNACVQHIWQVVNPDACVQARQETDAQTLLAVRTTMGLQGQNSHLPQSCVQQIFLPQRFGGLGYRHSADTYRAAFIGGFALAAHGPHSILDIYPPLREDVTVPESSTLPSMVALCDAWRTEVLLTTRATVLAKAVAAKAICPVASPDLDDDMMAAILEEKALDQQEIDHELKWKSEFVLGKTIPTGTGASPQCYYYNPGPS